MLLKSSSKNSYLCHLRVNLFHGGGGFLVGLNASGYYAEKLSKLLDYVRGPSPNTIEFIWDGSFQLHLRFVPFLD